MKSSKKKSSSSASPMLIRPLKLWQDDSNNLQVAIEVLPLIDVIFCILTFFILAAVSFSRQQAITLDLPKANTGTPQMRQMLIVSLDSLGQIYVEKEAVTTEMLAIAIKNYHQLYPNGLMVLYASKSSSYNEVIQLLDVLRSQGGDRVALATLPEDTQNLPNSLPNPDQYNPYNPLFVPLPNQTNPNP